MKRSISLTGQYAAVDDMLTGQENLEMMGRLLHLSRHGGPGTGRRVARRASTWPTRPAAGPATTPAA